MAEILVHPHEFEKGALPSVCVVCGADQATPVNTKLAVIAAEHAFTRTLRVRDAWLPLCARHQWHFQRRTIFALGAVGCIVAMLPVMACYAFTIGQLLSDTPLAIPCGLGLVVAMIATIVVIAVFGKRGNVQPAEVNQQGAVLTNVSDRFVAAVVAARQRESL